jgi:hypothetical protein
MRTVLPRIAIAAMFLIVTACAHATRVELYDRTADKVLPTYSHKGRLYVAGEPGHEYEIRITSDTTRRVLAVTTIDGVNVVTGETGATHQSGYVLDPHGFVRIEGWRKSMSRTAAFYFTRLPDTYAARTGRPDNVGVIGIALFRERAPAPQPCCRAEQDLRRQGSSAASAPALQEGMADAVESQRKNESKLGTGHGRSEYSAAEYTEFKRASATPDETIVIYYDSHRNLIAQGVMPSRPTYARDFPRPFPNSFVPDP